MLFVPLEVLEHNSAKGTNYPSFLSCPRTDNKALSSRLSPPLNLAGIFELLNSSFSNQFSLTFLKACKINHTLLGALQLWGLLSSAPSPTPSSSRPLFQQNPAQPAASAALKPSLSCQLFKSAALSTRSLVLIKAPAVCWMAPSSFPHPTPILKYLVLN